jgi:hypothetical protein
MRPSSTSEDAAPNTAAANAAVVLAFIVFTKNVVEGGYCHGAYCQAHQHKYGPTYDISRHGRRSQDPICTGRIAQRAVLRYRKMCTWWSPSGFGGSGFGGSGLATCSRWPPPGRHPPKRLVPVSLRWVLVPTVSRKNFWREICRVVGGDLGSLVLIQGLNEMGF